MGAEVASFGEIGYAAPLEEGAGEEGLFLIEVVVDRGMDVDELLQVTQAPAPAPLHHALPPSKSPVGILCAIILPQPNIGFRTIPIQNRTFRFPPSPVGQQGDHERRLRSTPLGRLGDRDGRQSDAVLLSQRIIDLVQLQTPVD